MESDRASDQVSGQERYLVIDPAIYAVNEAGQARDTPSTCLSNLYHQPQFRPPCKQKVNLSSIFEQPIWA